MLEDLMPFLIFFVLVGIPLMAMMVLLCSTGRIFERSAKGRRGSNWLRHRRYKGGKLNL